eukprot:7246285-Alexandrium_andersonii.AAC.1
MCIRDSSLPLRSMRVDLHSGNGEGLGIGTSRACHAPTAYLAGLLPLLLDLESLRFSFSFSGRGAWARVGPLLAPP